MIHLALRAAIIGTAICTVAGASRAAAAAACAEVDAANIKQSQTPFHSTTIDNGKQAQSIMVGSSRYMQMAGKWFKRPYHASDIQLAAQTPGTSCAAAGHEAVQGEPASVYTVHHSTGGASADMKYWISVSRGLPLRTSTVLTLPNGKHQIEVKYDYANIRAPM